MAGRPTVHEIAGSLVRDHEALIDALRTRVAVADALHHSQQQQIIAVRAAITAAEEAQQRVAELAPKRKREDVESRVPGSEKVKREEAIPSCTPSLIREEVADLFSSQKALLEAPAAARVDEAANKKKGARGKSVGRGAAQNTSTPADYWLVDTY